MRDRHTRGNGGARRTRTRRGIRRNRRNALRESPVASASRSSS